jgi:hypothetical protein
MLITNSNALAEARAASTSPRMTAYKVPAEAAPAEREKAANQAVQAIESRCKKSRRSVTIIVVEGAR